MWELIVRVDVWELVSIGSGDVASWRWGCRVEMGIDSGMSVHIHDIEYLGNKVEFKVVDTV